MRRKARAPVRPALSRYIGAKRACPCGGSLRIKHFGGRFLASPDCVACYVDVLTSFSLPSSLAFSLPSSLLSWLPFFYSPFFDVDIESATHNLQLTNV
jgi:hypothetical protein